MSKSIVGSPFDEKVVEQIKVRESIFSSTVRDNDKLLYLNANSIWIRLSSSIDTDAKTVTIPLDTTLSGPEQWTLVFTGPEQITLIGDNTLANNYILGNGVYQNRGTLTGGINKEKGYNPVQNPGNPRKGTYQNTESRGIRPEPGIVGLDVKTKNTYGTLREATVQLTVWSLEDLELIQKLYLRPGYTVLLEWGHTLWMNNEGELDKTIRTFNEFTEGRIEQDTIYKKIEDLKSKSDYNYDAVYGYVVNFEWSFRQDGGYDCMVKIISRGNVLESLTHIFKPEGRLPNTEFRTTEDSEKNKIERTSVLHKFALECSKIDWNYRRTAAAAENRIRRKQALDSKFNSKYATDFINKLRDFPIIKFGNQTEEGSGWLGTTWLFGEKVNSIAVPLYTILDIFNQFIATVGAEGSEPGSKVVRFYTGQGEKLSTPYEKECKFITSDYHFSINPLVCTLLKEPKPLTSNELIKAGLTTPSSNQIEVLEKGLLEIKIPNYVIHENLESLTKDMKGDTDDILNILVGVSSILSSINEIVKSTEDPKKGFYFVIEELIERINQNLGGVNQLSIHCDDTENIHYIVDRKLTPPNKEDVSELSLSGLKTTLTSLKVNSRISSQMASQISIAAQGGGTGKSTEEIAGLTEWNKGLIDRHTPVKSVVSSTVDKEDKEKETERLIQHVTALQEARKKFGKGTYDEPAFMELESYHREFCNRFVIGDYIRKTKSVPGIIPVEMSLEMIGIGGLKVGQAFKVSPGVLPDQYLKNFGFIITGLSHTVQNNRWMTSLKTQFFPLANN